MMKPVLLIADDDPQVLAAVRRDLRSKYRERCTIIGASSGEEALARLPARRVVAKARPSERPRVE